MWGNRMGEHVSSSTGGDRQTGIAVLLAGLLLAGAVAAGFGVAPAAAESQNAPGSVVVADAESADWFDDSADVTVEVEENVTASPGSTVSLAVTAESNDGNWWLTGGEVDYFVLTLEYDEEKLDFEGVNGSGIGSVAVIDQGEGYVTLENEFGFGDLFADNALPLTLVTTEFTVSGAEGVAQVSPAEESTVGYGFGLQRYEHDVAYQDGGVSIEGSNDDGGRDQPALTSLRASNEGGWLAFGEETREDARATGFELPDRQLIIEGQLDESGNWRSTTIETPTVNLDNGLQLTIEAPNGLSGELDRENDRMTAEGRLDVRILAAGEPQFSFSIDATSGESGALSGSAAFSDDSGAATLVDNEFTVEETTGNPIIDGSLDLPIKEPGRAWLELPLDVGFDPGPPEPSYAVTLSSASVTAGDAVEITGTVENTGSDAGEQAVTLAVADQSVTESLALEPGESETVSLTWETSEGDGGEYDATIETADDSDSATVAVSAPVTEFQVTDLVGSYGVEGDPIDIEATIENTGNAAGEQTVTAAIAGESFTETVAIDPDSTETVVFTWQTSEGDAGEYEATVETEDDTTSFVVTVEEPPTGQKEFEATNRGGDATDTGGGWIAFDEDNRTVAIEEGVAFPAEGISINGIVDGQTWESTSVEFPTVETESGIEADVEAPNGLSGTFNDVNDTITAEGELDVTIRSANNPTVSFDIAATTGESGSLSGEASIGEQAGTATLVDNEFTIDDPTLNPIVDGALGLPIEEPGRSWLELPLEFDFQQDEPEPGETDQIVIGFPDDTENIAGKVLEIASEDAEIVDVQDTLNFVVIEAPEDADVEALADELDAHPETEYAQLDRVVTPDD